MRLFIALDLPNEIRDFLATLQRDWQRATGHVVHWAKPANLHLTLKFLGDACPDPTSLIASLAALPRSGPLSLYTSTFQHFPPRGAVRIVAVNLDGDTNRLHQLVDAIESVAEPHGVPRESRPFHPHITLGRARPAIQLRTTTIPAVPLSTAFTIDHFTLYQSHLKPTGPEYVPLASFPL